MTLTDKSKLWATAAAAAAFPLPSYFTIFFASSSPHCTVFSSHFLPSSSSSSFRVKVNIVNESHSIVFKYRRIVDDGVRKKGPFLPHSPSSPSSLQVGTSPSFSSAYVRIASSSRSMCIHLQASSIAHLTYPHDFHECHFSIFSLRAERERERAHAQQYTAIDSAKRPLFYSIHQINVTS